ncbi:N-6 DNA methylase [uncultured Aquimarina sp.]|uniref:class I SAM-dependent DNA methyltransferase n=1 Tax=uncultured Aquimarina sp. TaxID=575652 RepID=UPI0026160BEF|nr:N-6 DNA methylase [uncultured Aquimarina sp.]
MLSSDLKSKINKLWDKFWSRGITNPISAIEQISYLLFMRRIDELDTLKLQQAGFTEEDYRTVFLVPKIDKEGKPIFNKKGELEFDDKSNCRWSHFKQLDPESMLNLVSQEAFPFIKVINKKVDLKKIEDKDVREKVKKQLYGDLTNKEIEQEFAYVRYMENAVFLINNSNLLDEAVKAIDDIYDVIKKQQDEGQNFQDTQGDVYEYLLNEIGQSGKNGQFRTPRHIIQLMCEILDPDWTDTICDPACGTGGFLLGAYQHILTKYSSKKYLQKDENGFVRGTMGDKITKDTVWKNLKEKTFYGFDIDQTMVRIGLMNLMLHDISVPRIEHIDTLSNKYEGYEKDEQYSIVLANPPFTGRIDKGGMSDKFRIPGTQSELLFIDRMVRMLKPGGKAAVIIPEGVLFGSGKAQKKAREILLRDTQLEAVISLPSGAFQPYTGVKTAILVFTKAELESKKWHTDRVWFYNLKSDGYSLDNNRKRLKDEPLPLAVKKYHRRSGDNDTDQKEEHFYVDLDTIKENDLDLSFNRYKTFDYTPQEYDPPKEILKTLLSLENDIQKELNELNDMIG